LHLLAGYKFREISTMLDIPQSTVRWMYGEALKTLKDALEKEEQI
ncbi:MAG TPA: RNA polymerase sigma factor, partial [Clostridiales bacterium]|nr:RNA polymerase sigma factor [Clostridiales bacterium]